jgi:hypothetical protein
MYLQIVSVEEMGKLLSQKARGVSFQVIGDECWAKVRQHTDTPVNVTRVRLHCLPRQPLLPKTFGKQAFSLLLHLAHQNLLAVLGYPHEMIFYRVVGLAGWLVLPTCKLSLSMR